MFFTYILKSLTNKKVYVGSTSKEVARRLDEHNIGANKWTKANGPFKLIYYESFVWKTDAVLREKFYKSGVGKQLRDLIVAGFGVNDKIQ